MDQGPRMHSVTRGFLQGWLSSGSLLRGEGVAGQPLAVLVSPGQQQGTSWGSAVKCRAKQGGHTIMNLRSSGLGEPQEQDCPPCPSSNDETGSSLWSYPPRTAKVLLLPRPYPQDLGATRVGTLWPGMAPSLCVKLRGCRVACVPLRGFRATAGLSCGPIPQHQRSLIPGVLRT